MSQSYAVVQAEDFMKIGGDKPSHLLIEEALIKMGGTGTAGAGQGDRSTFNGGAIFGSDGDKQVAAILLRHGGSNTQCEQQAEEYRSLQKAQGSSSSWWGRRTTLRGLSAAK